MEENKIKKAFIKILPNKDIQVELVTTKKWLPINIDYERITLFNDFEETSSIDYELDIPELKNNDNYVSYYTINKDMIFIYYYLYKPTEDNIRYKQLNFKQLN